MTNLYQSLILGVVQGLTEFIPVSSSAHLVLIPYFLRWEEVSVTFNVYLHLGTLLAVIIYYRSILFEILKSIIHIRSGKIQDINSRKLLLYLIIGTLPVAVVGILFKERIEKVFENVLGVSIFLIITGILLLLGEKRTDGEKEIHALKFLDVMIIGLAQGVAIMPGISRSGSTIVAGLFRGLKKEAAAHFAFLLSLPAILGAGIVKTKDLFLPSNLVGVGFLPTNPESPSQLIIGFLAAFLSGYLAIIFLISVLKRKRLKVFAYYCGTVGLFSLIYYFNV